MLFEAHVEGCSLCFNSLRQAMENQRRYSGGPYEKYSIEEKKACAEVVKTCKIEYDAVVERLKCKYHWDAKRKRHVKDQPKEGVLLSFCFTLIYHPPRTMIDFVNLRLS